MGSKRPGVGQVQETHALQPQQLLVPQGTQFAIDHRSNGTQFTDEPRPSVNGGEGKPSLDASADRERMSSPDTARMIGYFAWTTEYPISKRKTTCGEGAFKQELGSRAELETTRASARPHHGAVESRQTRQVGPSDQAWGSSKNEREELYTEREPG